MVSPAICVKGADTNCQVICEDHDPLPKFALLVQSCLPVLSVCLVLSVLLEPSSGAGLLDHLSTQAVQGNHSHGPICLLK